MPFFIYLINWWFHAKWKSGPRVPPTSNFATGYSTNTLFYVVICWIKFVNSVIFLFILLAVRIEPGVRLCAFLAPLFPLQVPQSGFLHAECFDSLRRQASRWLFFSLNSSNSILWTKITSLTVSTGGIKIRSPPKKNTLGILAKIVEPKEAHRRRKIWEYFSCFTRNSQNVLAKIKEAGRQIESGKIAGTLTGVFLSLRYNHKRASGTILICCEAWIG